MYKMDKSVFSKQGYDKLGMPDMNITNNLTFSFCETIAELGGFDNFLETLDFSILDTLPEYAWPNLRKYLKERKGEVA